MQEGDFTIELRSILARKVAEDDEGRKASVLMESFRVSIPESTDRETPQSEGERKQGWLDFLFGPLNGFMTITA